MYNSCSWLQFGDDDGDLSRLPSWLGDRDGAKEQEQRDRLQSRDRKRNDGGGGGAAGAGEDRENRTLPTLLAQRMVAYPALVEDGEDEADTTAFRRRVKDSTPLLGSFVHTTEAKVGRCSLPGSM